MLSFLRMNLDAEITYFVKLKERVLTKAKNYNGELIITTIFLPDDGSF